MTPIEKALFIAAMIGLIVLIWFAGLVRGQRNGVMRFKGLGMSVEIRTCPHGASCPIEIHNGKRRTTDV